MKDFLFVFLLSIVFVTCSKEPVESPSIQLLSITANGVPLSNGTINVDQQLVIRINFSKQINTLEFTKAYSLKENGIIIDGEIIFTQSNTTVILSYNELKLNTSYSFQINSIIPIGINGERLTNSFEVNFTTKSGSIITELEPCINASELCYENIPITSNSVIGLYSSYPLLLENARWDKLRNAVISIHGQTRNADDYFNYMMSAILTNGHDRNTILISPQFSSVNSSNSAMLGWSGNAWREGQNSDQADISISSFDAIDHIVAMLGDQTKFPILENIIIAGHSSGATFCHTYACSNQLEKEYPNISFYYTVANSQYFYYPKDLRWDENSQTYTTPNQCSNFNLWPYGFINTPPYLTGTNREDINNQFVIKNIAYVLGQNDTSVTGTLNTTDCAATLLGDNRLDRGQKMMGLMNDKYFGIHNHSIIPVPNIGHNAESIFNSSAFKDYLNLILN